MIYTICFLLVLGTILGVKSLNDYNDGEDDYKFFEYIGVGAFFSAAVLSAILLVNSYGGI